MFNQARFAGGTFFTHNPSAMAGIVLAAMILQGTWVQGIYVHPQLDYRMGQWFFEPWPILPFTPLPEVPAIDPVTGHGMG
jgi:hypothetical protein